MMFSLYGELNIIDDDSTVKDNKRFNIDKHMYETDNLLSLTPSDFINNGFYFEISDYLYRTYTNFSDDTYTLVVVNYSRN